MAGSKNKEPIPLHPKQAAAAKKKGKRSDSIKRFMRDLRAEFKKIIWPNAHTVFTHTVVVVVTMIVIGARVTACDSLCVTGFDKLVNATTSSSTTTSSVSVTSASSTTSSSSTSS